MTNKQAIEILSIGARLPDSSATHEIIEACKLACDALSCMDDGNLVLTKEDLSTMKGKPIWIVPLNFDVWKVPFDLRDMEQPDFSPKWVIFDPEGIYVNYEHHEGRLHHLTIHDYNIRWCAYRKEL